MEASGNSPLEDESIIYNTTIKVDPQIEKEWIVWQKDIHIPEVMATGLFSDFKFFRLLEQDETDGITYVIQYFTSSIDLYKKYIDEFASLLNEKVFARWSDRFISFHTVMKIVN
ncbi:MAG TPA: DUF4286 family protein [Chitinophagaceae bacterium]|jgi:uncharacterized protein DUF4286|nr:DUF4286 family protein [Chitinophagaceae bacterium]